MRELFAADPRRAYTLRCEAGPLTLHYSCNRIDRQILAALIALARACDMDGQRAALFSGAPLNTTEQRPALHSALRAPAAAGAPHAEAVAGVLERIARVVEALRAGQWPGFDERPVRDVVSIGIGGSDLGPRMAVEALRPWQHPDLNLHFVANIDPSELHDLLTRLDPATTLFIVASKSFTTQETLSNAEVARQWLLAAGAGERLSRHFLATSASPARAEALGVAPAHVFPLWDWVGGRYSLWSAIGLPLAIAVGMDRFREMLAGAHALDRHFAEAPLADNAPLLLALLEIWYVNFLGARSVAVLPYDHRLRLLPSYLQQLTMESNGKSCDLDGQAIAYPTCPVVWGAEGSNSQHSFHQLLHQGSPLVPVDFLLPLHSLNPVGRQHELLVANCLAQQQVLLRGRSAAEVAAEMRAQGASEADIQRLQPHRVMPGNRPSNLITFDRSTPEVLGALLALYEHKVFAQSVIWHINPFDQFGVELGKQVGQHLFDALQQPRARIDPALAAVFDNLRRPPR
jgi:glucose-6-phosphate isomerase